MYPGSTVHLIVGRIVSARVRGTHRYRAVFPVVAMAVTLLLAMPSFASAQRIFEAPEKVLSLSKGASLLLETDAAIERVSVGEPGVADVTTLSQREVLVNAKEIGVTTLLVWTGGTSGPKLYSIEVTADASGLQRYLNDVLPGEKVVVSASGNTVTLSGQVRDASAATRAVEIAKGSGAVVIDNLSMPTALQVLLEVRFAEVNRSAVAEWSSTLSTVNPHELDDDGRWTGRTSSDGTIDFSLFNPGSSIEAAFRALRSRGDFKELAEPNLVTLPGKEAFFLAGGEFPYPTVQGGGGTNAVSIAFRAFGIMLRFTPTIMRNGNIRLKVVPEVSSLDFANALTFSGFVVPSLLTRRVETEVELKEGQHLAIGGLLDNSTLKNVSKIPVLGDLPILGALFRSTSARERRTELLVIVTPKLVGATETLPPVPTGEPSTWDWSRRMRPARTDTTGRK